MSINENEDTVKYVYLSDEGIYGTIVSYGAYASIIEYYDAGIRYTIEVINDDFIIIDEIGIGYVDEIEEEEELE